MRGRGEGGERYLDWEVVGPEAEVVSAAHRRELGAHVHFQMLEEVVILKWGWEEEGEGKHMIMKVSHSKLVYSSSCVSALFMYICTFTQTQRSWKCWT